MSNLCWELWLCWRRAFFETRNLCVSYLFQDAGEPCDKDDECPVCFEDYVAGEGRTTRCGHGFCRRCLVMWRKRSKECPVCRQDL